MLTISRAILAPAPCRCTAENARAHFTVNIAGESNPVATSDKSLSCFVYYHVLLNPSGFSVLYLNCLYAVMFGVDSKCVEVFEKFD